MSLINPLARRGLLLVACDTASILGAVLLAGRLLPADARAFGMGTPAGLLGPSLFAITSQLCLYYCDLHDLRLATSPGRLALRVAQSLGVSVLVLAPVCFLFPRLNPGRAVLLALPLLLVFISAWRIVLRWIARRSAPEHRLLLVGTNPSAVALARELFERRHEWGVEIVGFIDPDRSRIGAPVINPRVIGSIEDIPRIVAAQQVDRVVLGLHDARGKLPMEAFLSMRLGGIRFDHLTSVYEEFTGKIAVEDLRPSWLIFSKGFRKGPAAIAVKRALDLVVASVGLLLALPLIAAAALAIVLTSGWPVLYHQERVGEGGRPFTLHKFRSMRADAERGTGAVWARQDDPRITGVGRFLRRTRVDEIPQLWNVLMGEMSLVGPRPERPEFVERLTREIPFYGQRHVAKPGVTGWAQVRYCYGASVVDAMEKLQYDLYYIKNMSIALDLVVVFETVKTVLLGRGSR